MTKSMSGPSRVRQRSLALKRGRNCEPKVWDASSCVHNEKAELVGNGTSSPGDDSNDGMGSYGTIKPDGVIWQQKDHGHSSKSALHGRHQHSELQPPCTTSPGPSLPSLHVVSFTWLFLNKITTSDFRNVQVALSVTLTVSNYILQVQGKYDVKFKSALGKKTTNLP